MKRQNIFFDPGQNFPPVKDLGDEEIMKALRDLYITYLESQRINLERFREKIFRFFDFCETKIEKYSLHDKFFTYIAHIWRHMIIYLEKINQARSFWDSVLGLVYEWEKNNKKRIHKGTPYYFYGVTNIIADDISSGFLLMHQAFREDRITTQEIEQKDFPDPKTPAYSFITLNYENINQYYQPKVIEIASFLSDKIKDYVSKRGSNLTLEDFKNKFLEKKERTLIIDIVYYFIYSLFQLNKLFNMRNEVTENKFASMLEANIIFDLCLVLDKTIAYKNPDNESLYLRDQIRFLCDKNNVNLVFNKIKNFGSNEVKISGFDTALEKLLNSQSHNIKTLLEEDFAVSHICRNYGAHNLRNESLIYKRFKDIIQRILNSIFYSVEKLH